MNRPTGRSEIDQPAAARPTDATSPAAETALQGAEAARRVVEQYLRYRDEGVVGADERVAVAFSGGVDSSVAAKGAVEAFGRRAVAVTGSSASLSADEAAAARATAVAIGIEQVVLSTNEFANPAYVRNDGTRCYHCKSELYKRIAEAAVDGKFGLVCSGANADDAGDYRPGLTAAAERNVRHPLWEAGLGKADVRAAARFWNLPNHDKPASPCLSSRLAVGVAATAERVERVEKAEHFLRGYGFHTLRVRYHEGGLARIEVPAGDLARLMEPSLRDAVARRFRDLGFQFVSVDLEGFRSGSLNVLTPADLQRRFDIAAPVANR
ncbi:MAG: ATP-dependent sacrificial sulfur transferase LarE [Planctomycetia bacterium]